MTDVVNESRCDICLVDFATKQAVDRHKEKRSKCTPHPDVLARIAAAGQPIPTHKANPHESPCPYCGLPLASEQSLARHLAKAKKCSDRIPGSTPTAASGGASNSQTPEPTHWQCRCMICDELKASKQSLARHLTKTKKCTPTIPIPVDLKCSECAAAFQDVLAYCTHMKSQHSTLAAEQKRVLVNGIAPGQSHTLSQQAYQDDLLQHEDVKDQYKKTHARYQEAIDTGTLMESLSHPVRHVSSDNTSKSTTIPDDATDKDVISQIVHACSPAGAPSQTPVPCEEATEFPINLDTLQVSLGYSKKSNLVCALQRDYQEGVDYVTYSDSRSGRRDPPNQVYAVTVECARLMTFRCQSRKVDRPLGQVPVTQDRAITHVRRISSQEEDCIGFFYRSFHKSLTCLLQYPFGGNYRADMYIKELHMILECDENGHRRYDTQHEASRNAALTVAGFCVYRFDPKSADFDLAEVVATIAMKALQPPS